MKVVSSIILIACSLLGAVQSVFPQAKIDLSGTWQFRLDPERKGHEDKWFGSPRFEESVRLPGTTDTNEKGYRTLPWPDDSVARKFRFPGAFEKPEWIYEINGAPTRKYKYIGPAWYQKEIEIPTTWEDKRLEIFLERSLFKVELWINGERVGVDMSLYAPRVFDITNYVKTGQKNRITLCIDNTNTIGGQAHGYTYNTQTNWNGVVGKMELRQHDNVYRKASRVFTDIHEKAVRVEAKVANYSGKEQKAKFCFAVEDKKGNVLAEKVFERTVQTRDDLLNFYIPVGDPVVLWDEFTPELYTLTMKMEGVDGSFKESYTEKFGFREIGSNGTTLTINGRPTFFRGTIDCAIFPKTGYMPTDKASWRKVLGAVKEYGMNHLRYHSVCPPKAAFEVADELGVYLQAELIWGPTVDPKNSVHDYLYNDGFRMLETFGNHASFVMMTLGNELSSENKYKNRLVDIFRKTDPRRLYSSQTQVYENPTPKGDDVRYSKHWPDKTACFIERFKTVMNNDFDYSAGRKSSDVPLIIHENGQWVMYPGFEFLGKFDGVLKPVNFTPFYNELVKNGLEDQDHQMALASGKQGAWYMKQTIEALLRTEGMGGFQYLSLSDFPGQSEAMVGILDAFWDSKGYITPEEVRQFCSETVPLLRFEKWVYTTAETFQAKASVANYGPQTITGKKVTWAIVDEDGEKIKKGNFGKPDILQGEVSQLGTIHLELNGIKKSGQYWVQVEVEGTPYKNKWDFYIYPAEKEVAPAQSVYIAHQFDATVQQKLENGENVLLLWPVEDFGGNVQKISFSPHYWSYNCGALGRVYPGSSGLLCDPEHPFFKNFPSNFHGDARWIEMIEGANAFVLNKLPKSLKPTVQIIDDLHRNNKLASLFEAKVGKGKLLACAFDVENDLNNRPVARQFLRSLLAYVQGGKFIPEITLSMEDLTQLLSDPTSINKVIEGSSKWPLHDFRNMLDGDPQTFWSSEWNGNWRASHSHYVIIELGRERTLSGCHYTPRQDSENGRVGKYEIYLSNDGENWGEPVANGVLENSTDVQDIKFVKKQSTKYVKFVSLKEVNNRRWAAVADLEFY